MGYMDRKNIKVSEDTFETLEADKPDGVTWDRYLTEMHRHAKARFPNRDNVDFSDWRDEDGE